MPTFTSYVRGHKVLVAGWLVASVILIALVYAWTGISYIDLSDGVYLYTSRALLQGHAPYAEVVSSVPPPLLWVGATLLALNDGLATVRLAMASLLLATAGFVFYITFRLCGMGWIAAGAGLLSIVTPYHLKQGLALIGENFQAVLLLLATVLAADRRHAWKAGAVVAFGASFKLTLLIIAPLFLLVAVPRVKYIMGFVFTLVSIWVVSYLLYGKALITDTIVAQSKSGLHSFSEIIEFIYKAGFIELGLIVLAIAGLFLRQRSSDERLYRAVLVAAAGSFLMLVAVLKEGTGPYISIVSEPLLVILAASALAWSLGLTRAAMRTVVVVLSASAFLFTLAEDTVFIKAPAPIGPLKNPIYGRNASPAQVQAVLDRIDSCPRDLPYSGPPYYAFLSSRKMAGNQPDLFLFNIAGDTTLSAKKMLIENDLPRACPLPEPYQFKHY